MKVVAFILSIVLSINVLGTSYLMFGGVNPSPQKKMTIANDTYDASCNSENVLMNADKHGVIKDCCSKGSQDKDDKNNCCGEDCDCNCCHSVLLVKIQLPQNQDKFNLFNLSIYNFSKTIFGYQCQKGLDFNELIIHPPAFV